MTRNLLSFFVVVLIVGLSSANSQVPDIGGRVAFASDRDGTWNLHVYDLENGLTSKLTDFPGELGILELGSIHWSKDGKRILFDGFTGWTNGGHNYFVINDDGSGLRKITEWGGYDYICRWDPLDNETLYAFEGHNAPPDVLHKVNLRTNEDTTILLDWYNWGFDLASSGESFFFTRWYFPNSIIGRHDLLTHSESTVYSVPDGGAGSIDISGYDNWILFDVQVMNAGATNNLRKINPDATIWVNLTNEEFPSPVKNYSACWVSVQNDGYICFTTNYFGNEEIVLMKADGHSYPSGMINLTNNPARDMNGEWTPTSSFIDVEIDIKPGTSPNMINLGSNGNIPVAILSTPAFDSNTIDPLSISLSGAYVLLKGKGTPSVSIVDVNGDSLLDMLVHVDTTALQLSLGDTTALLQGVTYSGRKIRGSDSVRIVN